MLRRCSRCDTVSAEQYADPAEVYVAGYMSGNAGPFGIDASHPTFQRYLGRVARRRIEIVESVGRVKRGSWLDVGCGTGEVLGAARSRGWATTGVEPEQSSAAAARARGLDVRATTLERSGLPQRSFDVVSAFHVLEHMPDSRAFLASLRRWARPGGFVVIEVPNWRTVQRRRLRQHWSALRPGEHLVHFTPDTLTRTLRSAGIEPLRTRTPMYLGPPQSVEHALNDLGRYGRLRRLIGPFTAVRAEGGVESRYPTRAGWMLLRMMEMVYDKAGVGSVVLCIGVVR